MIGFIAEVVSNDTGMLRMTLGILVRRGAIAAAADWLSVADSPTTFARRLVTDPHLFGAIEEAVGRGLEMLRASQKRVGPVAIIPTGPIDNLDDHALVIGRIQDIGEDLNEDESDGRRGTNLAAVTAVGMDEEEAEADPATVAADAVASALQGCRRAYALLVSRSLEALAAKAFAAIAEGDEAGYTGGEIAALPLLMRVLRSFHGADAFFSAEGGALESSLLGTATQEETATLIEKTPGFTDCWWSRRPLGDPSEVNIPFLIRTV